MSTSTWGDGTAARQIPVDHPQAAAPVQAAGPAHVREERRLLDDRRQAIGIGGPSRDGQPHYVALALSGGGIRSATFSLGVLEALAQTPVPAAPGAPAKAADAAAASASPKTGDVFRASRLSRIDYLSTVSGGGYAGAFLCSLFQPNRLRRHGGQAPAAGRRRSPLAAGVDEKHVGMAADDAVKVLTSGPPGRIRSEGAFDGDAILKAPLAWLRENGRYLIPTGTGDAFYVAALAIRNWLALHYVIGVALIGALAAVGLLRAALSASVGPFHDLELRALQAAVATDGTSIGPLWWSTLFPLMLVPLLVAGLPLGIAFWFANERIDGTSRPFNFAVLCSAVVAAGMALLGWSLLTPAARVLPTQTLPAPYPLLAFALAGEILLGILCYVAVAAPADARAVTVQRVRLTRGLSTVLAVIVCIGAIAAIDTLGQSLYLASTSSRTHPAIPALTPGALVAALVWLVKRFAAKEDHAIPGWLARLPLRTLAGLGGVLVFVLVGALWSLLVHWLVWLGERPAIAADLGSGPVKALGAIVAIGVVLSAVTGHFSAFINLSSLQSFYSARLARAYMGATNGERFKAGSAALSAAEPLAGDDLSMEHYFGRRGRVDGVLTTFAPLHMINVTVNKTVDPAEQLVQRDRKGQPMAVLPFGFSIDSTDIAAFPKPKWLTAVSRPLLVGQWIGASGAAFSTGIGRETSLGMSLLLGAANVRLGTWWDSGLGIVRFRSAFDRAVRAIGAVFRTQAYLSYELRARFFGTKRSWQYLSDGGHFENTAMYELLRSDRRVVRIFACDCGADPGYGFADLANLIRLARIDLDVEIEVQRDFEGRLGSIFAAPEAFRRMSPRPTPGQAGPDATACAVLLWVRQRGEASPRTQVVLFKPNVPWDAAADVRQYAMDHAAFPQEPTSDQFFDEAQWESYRALGFHLGRKVFDAAVMRELDDLARARIPGLASL